MIDWATSNDIEVMLKSLDHASVVIELRLFAADCAARVLQHLPEPEFSAALAASRDFANGNTTSESLDAVVDSAALLLTPNVIQPTVRDFAGSAVIDAASSHPPSASTVWTSVSCALQAVACAAADSADDDTYDSVYDSAMTAESTAQCDLLRAHIPHLP